MPRSKTTYISKHIFANTIYSHFVSLRKELSPIVACRILSCGPQDRSVKMLEAATY